MSWSQKPIDNNLEIVKEDSNQTHVEFARSKEQLFDRWCCSKKIDQNYDKLRQLVLKNSNVVFNLMLRHS